MTEIAEKIAGLTAGADDYVAKPFDFEELVARLRTLLRRPRDRAARDVHVCRPDASTPRAAPSIAAIAASSSRRASSICLRVFAEHAEEVLTRSQLLDMVWGIDRDVIPNTVETYVSFLRAKLDSGEPVKLIQTLRGAGYTLRATPS